MGADHVPLMLSHDCCLAIACIPSQGTTLFKDSKCSFTVQPVNARADNVEYGKAMKSSTPFEASRHTRLKY